MSIKQNSDYKKLNWIFKAISILALTLYALFIVYCYKKGIFRSIKSMQDFINQFKYIGIIIFIVIQATQVIIPVFPSGVGYVSATIFWGPVMGFIYNYMSICIGSFIAFYLARIYGKPILYKLFSENTINKYEKWTEQDKRFITLFALAILLPLVPDDFFCYLAGTTKMTFKQFAFIILVFKTFALLIYSLGVYMFMPR